MDLITLFACAEMVKLEGQTVFVKVDGQRQENWCTCLILFPDNSREVIRKDSATIEAALEYVLRSYFEERVCESSKLESMSFISRLVELVEIIKVDGNILAIEMDGNDDASMYSVVIAFAVKTQPSIESHGNVLSATIESALHAYFETGFDRAGNL